MFQIRGWYLKNVAFSKILFGRSTKFSPLDASKTLLVHTVVGFNNNNNVMYCQVWWPILEIGALHLTHPSAHTQQWVVNTHTVNTHPEQWAAIDPAPGEQLGVRCLAQGHLSHGIEGGESAVHSQSPPSMPDLRFEPTTFGLQVWFSNH